MANVLYPKYKEALLAGSPNTSLSTNPVKVCLIDTAAYTYNASHEFLPSLTGIVATSGALTSKSVTNGVFDADNVTFPGMAGTSVEAFVIFIDTGTPSTSRLVAFVDSGQTGLPLVPTGADGVITWDDGANKIFQL